MGLATFKPVYTPRQGRMACREAWRCNIAKASHTTLQIAWQFFLATVVVLGALALITGYATL